MTCSDTQVLVSLPADALLDLGDTTTSIPPNLPNTTPSHLTLESRKNPGVDSSLSSRASASTPHSASTGNPHTLWVPVGSSAEAA